MLEFLQSCRIRVRLKANRFSPFLMVLLFGLTFFLAILSWKYVEQPFRGPKSIVRSKNSLFSLSAAGLFVFIACGTLGSTIKIEDYIFDQKEYEIYSYNDYDAHGIYQVYDCFMMPGQSSDEFGDGCAGHGNGIIIGDSHAAALSSGFRDNYDFGQLSASGCPPVLGYNTILRPFCDEINLYRFEKITELQPEYLILHASWITYAQKGDTKDAAFYDPDLMEKLGDSIDYLKKTT